MGGNYYWNQQNVSNTITITYPKQLLNEVNQIFVTRPKGAGDTQAYDGDGVKSQSSTGFVSGGLSSGNSYANTFVWMVCGYAM